MAAPAARDNLSKNSTFEINPKSQKKNERIGGKNVSEREKNKIKLPEGEKNLGLQSQKYAWCV